MLIQEPINEIFTPNPLESIAEITRRYLDTIEAMGYMPKKNLIRHRRITLPQNLNHIVDEQERMERQKEYFRRWKYGYEDLCGTMYGYHNYASIHVRAGSAFVRPTYREYTNRTFELAESCLYGKSRYFGDNRGWGMIFLSKRGLGKSAEMGHLTNTVISVNKETRVLITSKSEFTGQEFLNEKVRQPYYKYPLYMRFGDKLSNNRNVFHLGMKTVKGGITEILGSNSKAIVRAPVPEANEGLGAKLWIHDEAGKTENLLTLIDNTLPALNGEDGFTRIGVPIITGVAGDFDKFGQDYILLWNEAETRNLKRWFVPGFAGMHMDDMGNEDIEKAVYDIFVERYKIWGHNNDSRLAEEMQKNPLTPEEALQSTSTSMFNKRKLFTQAKMLDTDNEYMRYGNLEWDDRRMSVTYHPKAKGTAKFSFIETPQHEGMLKGAYIAFIDAYDVQAKQIQGSKGAMYVFKRKARLTEQESHELHVRLQNSGTIREKLECHLRLGFLPVCEYIDNPDDPRSFAEYCSRICTWYRCKALVERKPSQIFSWFFDNAKDLLQYKPLKHTDTKIDRTEWGINVDEYWKDNRRGLLQAYVEDYADRIYFPQFILDATQYDDTVQIKKKDSVDALGGALIHDGQKKLLGNEDDMVRQALQRLFGVTKSGNRIQNTLR